MPTTITKSIGSGGGRDYSTPQTFENAVTIGMVAADEAWVGECYNDSEFTAASALLLISGQTTDATRNITLKCAAGQSFRDHASVRSNALSYNASNGVGLRITGSYTYCVRVETQYTTLDGLQIAAPDVGQGRGVLVAASNVTVRNCIIYARDCFKDSGSPTGLVVVNCLLVARTGTILNNAYAGARFEFCTMVRTASGGTPGKVSYATFTIENCAIFNFTTGFTTGGGGVLAGGFNCTDLASAPGSSNQVSKTFSAQFVSTTTDFRAATSGSNLVNGTPATSYATDDISATARDATTPTIGCWELAGGGGGASGQPTTKRWGGVPGMRIGGATFGQGWVH